MKRRTFVTKSMLASIAVSTTPSCFAIGNTFKDANNILNIGVIGTGKRGSELIHFLKQIDNIQIVACCDILPFRLQENLTSIEGKVKGYKEYRKILENQDLEAVLIATPFNSHAKIAIDALDAGKHVYCESTMAKGYAGTQNLYEKVKSANKTFQSGHQYRSSKLYHNVVDQIKNGKIGNITSIECQWNNQGDWRKPVSQSQLERLINWRMYKEFSGGLVAEQCSHQIDVVNWILGATPKKVKGSGGIDDWKDGRETYDNIHLLFDYPNDVKASFVARTSNETPLFKIEIHGDKGTMRLDNNKVSFFSTDQNKEKDTPFEITQEDPTKEALVDFRDHIVNNTVPQANVIEGAKTAICVQMAGDAMHHEKIVPWNSYLGI